MHRNALIYKRKIFLLTVKARPSNRQKFSLLISKGKSRDANLRGFDNYRQRSVDFSSDDHWRIETSKCQKDRHDSLTI